MTPLLSKSPDERRVCLRKTYEIKPLGHRPEPPLLRATADTTLSLTRRDHDVPGLIINPNTHMAWRPYENLIDGELDNRTPGKVTGWMRFFRASMPPLQVSFDLKGDFHGDIRGKVILLSNPDPMDRNVSLERKGTYMEGFGSMQRGEVGDITAGIPLGVWTEDLSRKLLLEAELFWEQSGFPSHEREKRRQKMLTEHRAAIDSRELFYPYVSYPYVEWYSETNGRVVLELDPEQVEILDGLRSAVKTAKELMDTARERAAAMGGFLSRVAKGFLRESSRRDAAAKPFGANQ